MHRNTIAALLILTTAFMQGAAAAREAAASMVASLPASRSTAADLPGAPAVPPVGAKAWLLLDATSGKTIAARNADERVEPASLTKIMTAYLVFQAVRAKTLQLEQSVNVSVHAWKIAPGSSKMFLEPGQQVSVDNLLAGLLVQSGNDAAVALAEAVAGSEDAFVGRMNDTARDMGLAATHFASPHGLPSPQTYSTARDLAMLAARLIRDFPDLYTRYDSMKQFRFNNITQSNRNRLLWIDPTVDGLKTGHTEAAGYCMIASAVRSGPAGPRRLISVVMGAASDKARTTDSATLLNWGYQAYETLKVYARGESLGTPTVWKGQRARVLVGFDNDVYATVPRNWVPRLHKVIISNGPLIAPLALDSQVGTVEMQVDGHTIARYPVVALQPVERAGVWGRSWDSMRLWVYHLMDEKPPA